MRPPRWAVWLLKRLVPRGRADDLVGDVEEAHERHLARWGRTVAAVLTTLEALDLARAIVWARLRRRWGAHISLLDLKLGLRMLVRYPGLTLVGGLAMAFAIWIGAGTFEILYQVVHPTLPLDEGDRIVGLRVIDAAANREEGRVLFDVETWRAELGSVTDLGAFRTIQRNLVTPGGSAEPARVAEISATAFRVARVPPLLGRFLSEEDERPGAPPVLVIGYDTWQSRFGGAADVVGEIVRLGEVRTTVVGVMPEGFGFPVNHGLWAPLRLDGVRRGPREGPQVQVFGRLGPGVTIEAARAELLALGQRASADHPETHEFLRPRIMPYARLTVGAELPELMVRLLPLGNVFPLMLLVVLCGNVALLMFARAATRDGELAVRNALGASRARIIGQLFAEALVLGTVAAAVGLAAAGSGLRWAFALIEEEFFAGAGLPFWFHAGLAPLTIVFTGVLTVVAAMVSGVLPALKVTRGVGARLKEATAGGGGMRFGGVWTVVIVSQVAATVVLPPVVFLIREEGAQVTAQDLGFASERYLTARLRATLTPASGDTSRGAFEARVRAVSEELRRRLQADPGVRGVTFAQRLPRTYHGNTRIELDGIGGGSTEVPTRVASTAVDIGYFDVLGVSVLAGRAFDPGDLSADAHVLIVNEPFVERALGGRNPIGRRVRFLSSELRGLASVDVDSWYEIVGVVRDLGMRSGAYGEPGMYRPSVPGAADPTHIMVHTRGDPASFAPQLRAIAMSVDPSLQLHDLVPLDDVTRGEAEFYGFCVTLVAVVSGIALLLSLAGIYSVMSFRVSRRTREIGVRVALGAEPYRIIPQILGRPLAHVGLGLLAGSGLAALMFFNVSFGPDMNVGVTPLRAAAVAGYAALMACVCATACIVPTRRALSIEPTEALRADG